MQNNHITGELVLFNECIQCSKWTTKERISIYYWILLIFSSDSEEHRKWMSVYLLLGPRTLPWFLWDPVRSVWCRCWGTPPTSAGSWRREPRPVSGRFSHTFFSPCHRKERGELLETYSGDLLICTCIWIQVAIYICIFLQVITVYLLTYRSY